MPYLVNYCEKFGFCSVDPWALGTLEVRLQSKSMSGHRDKICVHTLSVKRGYVQIHNTVISSSRWFGLYKGIFDLVQELAVLGFALLPWFWDIALAAAAKIGIWVDSEMFHTIIFVLLYSAVKTLVDLPWSLYNTFVIESRHGFNKQTPALFLGDLVKQVGSTLALY